MYRVWFDDSCFDYEVRYKDKHMALTVADNLIQAEEMRRVKVWDMDNVDKDGNPDAQIIYTREK
jgi:hypothetical protein